MILHKFHNLYYQPPQPQSQGDINVSNHYSPIDTSPEYLYVDISSIRIISPLPKGTNIQIEGIGPVHVKEHITEIIALLEGRNPAPSKILFGNKT